MKKNLEVGDKASVTKAFTQEEVAEFARVSGDTNPIHLDKEVAAASVFGQRVVHGMLTSSLFSALVGVEMPGKGSIYLGQSLTFKAPVFIDEEVTATVEITNIREDKPIVALRTTCVNSKGQIVVDGEAVVKVS